MIGCTLDSFS